MNFNKKSLYESQYFLIKRDFDHVHFIYLCIVCWLLLYIVHVGYMLLIQYQGRQRTPVLPFDHRTMVTEFL